MERALGVCGKNGIGQRQLLRLELALQLANVGLAAHQAHLLVGLPLCDGGHVGETTLKTHRSSLVWVRRLSGRTGSYVA